ncbi:MAG: hypothetical protein ACUVWZ_11150 [Anaerolineae bacterium]
MLEKGDKTTRPKPFRSQIVHGEPYQIGERTLIPVARIRSFHRARGTVGVHHFEGWGVGAAQITPVAMIEKSELDERTIPITRATATALWRMIAWAAAITLSAAVIRWQVRRWRA